MFHNAKIAPIRIAIRLILTLTLGGIALFAPNAAPAVRAQAFDFIMSVTGPVLVQPGQNLIYTVKLQNVSNRTFTNFVFFNDLPANTTYVSGGTLITDNGPAYVQFTLPTLAPNTTQTVSWVAKANSNLAVGSFIDE